MKLTMRAAAFCAALLSASAAHAAGYLMDRSADIALAKSERAWMAQPAFPWFWNPCARAPQCSNPSAMRSVSPYKPLTVHHLADRAAVPLAQGWRS
jgi:hypothetical protein